MSTNLKLPRIYLGVSQHLLQYSKSKRLVFLDLDGVVIPFASAGKKMRPAIPDPGAVNQLNRIFTFTGAHLVISSSWRKNCSMVQFDEMLSRWGVVPRVLGSTPLNEYTTRGKQISEWIDYVGREEQTSPFFLGDWKFVALDDDPEAVGSRFSLVRIDPLLGLAPHEADEAIRLLTE